MSYGSMVPLKGRVAIVTGGAGGIGLETSKALQENGATVVISDLNADRGEKVAQELGLEFFSAGLLCAGDLAFSMPPPQTQRSTPDRHVRRLLCTDKQDQ